MLWRHRLCCYCTYRLRALHRLRTSRTRNRRLLLRNWLVLSTRLLSHMNVSLPVNILGKAVRKGLPALPAPPAPISLHFFICILLLFHLSLSRFCFFSPAFFFISTKTDRQAANAARATLGINVAEYCVTDEPAGVTLEMTQSGASWGTVKGLGSLLDAGRRLVEEAG